MAEPTPAPTAAEFKAAYPEFALVPDAAVNTSLTNAGLKVSSPHWPDPYFTPAYMLLTAHLLTLRGLGTSAAAETAAEGFGVKRKRAGDTEIEWTSAGSGGSGKGDAFYLTTPYGVEFVGLRNMLFRGGPVFVPSRPIPADTPDTPFYPENYGVP